MRVYAVMARFLFPAPLDFPFPAMSSGVFPAMSTLFFPVTLRSLVYLKSGMKMGLNKGAADREIHGQ